MITIACGALSGFHAIIGSGTTPKMIGNERDVLFIGYGAMLVEGFVAIMALVAACVLIPADYFAINAAPAVYQNWAWFRSTFPTLRQRCRKKSRGGRAARYLSPWAWLISSQLFLS